MKHGYGINYYLLNETFMVGKWVENNIEGLVIFSTGEKGGEQIWKMHKNKVKKVFTELKEIEEAKASEDYKNLTDFYDMAIKKE
jgi:hypothetical protein